jgi:hypothetical protein
MAETIKKQDARFFNETNYHTGSIADPESGAFLTPGSGYVIPDPTRKALRA